MGHETSKGAAEALHRGVLSFIAVASILSGVAMMVLGLVGSSLLPGEPLLPRLVFLDVPPRFESILLGLIGLIVVVEGVLVFHYHEAGWWLALATGLVGVAHGVVALGSAVLPTASNVVFVLYLFLVRPLFRVPVRAS